MRGFTRAQLRAGQRGAALLILLGLISVILIYAVVAGLNRSAVDMAQERAQRTATALAQAKEALIAYAVTYKDTHDNPVTGFYTVPGYLPCPDLGPPATEGQAALNCPVSGPSSLVSVIGKLPWKTLGMATPRDGSGECLWYAVSGTYKNSPNGVSGSTANSNMMNWDTNGQFRVLDANSNILAGSSEDNRAVAVIFAPGAPLAGQDRAPVAGTANCGGNYNAAAYLDNGNGTLTPPSATPLAADFSSFVSGADSNTFNDKLVYITRAEIWTAIKKRSDFNNYLRALTRRAAECTAMYGAHNSGPGDNRLPWPSNVSLSTSLPQIYAVDARYNDNTAGTMSGRLSFRVDTSRGATGNTISTSTVSGTTNYYLPTSGSYCAYTPDQQVWYDNWKDQLFYAIANSFRPTAGASTSCGTCLKINGAGTYAAVVIFAGDKLTNAAGQVTQPRGLISSGNNQKGTIGNYLEGRNASNHPNIGGSGDYQAAAPSSTFNDIVYGIDSNLAVKCYDEVSGMVPVPIAPVAPPGDLLAYAKCP